MIKDSKKLTAKLVKNEIEELQGWHEKPSMIRSHWERPHTKLTAYAEGTPDFVSLDLETERLQSWHFFRYMDKALRSGQHDPQDMALATHYAYWLVLECEPLAKRDRGGDILIDNAALFWALQVMAGWKRRAAVVGEVLLAGLDSPMLDLRHTNRHYKGVIFPHFWFLMHLYTRWRGLPAIDTSLYSYPKAKNMAVYDAVLQNWKTKDVQQVAQWCDAMAEHHIRNTLTPADDKHEFDTYPLLPYEIWAYLRLREWQGLPNPAQSDLQHPLFAQPLGQMMPALPATQSASTPVLDAALLRYRQEFPDLRAETPIGS